MINNIIKNGIFQRLSWQRNLNGVPNYRPQITHKFSDRLTVGGAREAKTFDVMEGQPRENLVAALRNDPSSLFVFRSYWNLEDFGVGK